MNAVQKSVNGYVFLCPGCDALHAVRVGSSEGPSWTFNGDPERPTFSPSILVTKPLEYMRPKDAVAANDSEPEVCHSFIEDGFIRFLADSTHTLSGLTVQLPDLDEELET